MERGLENGPPSPTSKCGGRVGEAAIKGQCPGVGAMGGWLSAPAPDWWGQLGRGTVGGWLASPTPIRVGGWSEARKAGRRGCWPIRVGQADQGQGQLWGRVAGS